MYFELCGKFSDSLKENKMLYDKYKMLLTPWKLVYLVLEYRDRFELFLSKIRKDCWLTFNYFNASLQVLQGCITTN